MIQRKGLIFVFVSDRRTNPFGETEDDCSAESDGNFGSIAWTTFRFFDFNGQFCPHIRRTSRDLFGKLCLNFWPPVVSCLYVFVLLTWLLVLWFFPPADSLLQQVFAVRFLGSMAVRCGNNQEVIYEAMRQVLAARAIHNIFKTTESHLMVTSANLR